LNILLEIDTLYKVVGLDTIEYFGETYNPNQYFTTRLSNENTNGQPSMTNQITTYPRTPILETSDNKLVIIGGASNPAIDGKWNNQDIFFQGTDGELYLDAKSDASGCIRLHQNGNVDYSFLANGYATVNSAYGGELKKLSDGSMIFSGYDNGTNSPSKFSRYLCKINPDGTHNQTFNDWWITNTLFSGGRPKGIALLNNGTGLAWGTQNYVQNSGNASNTKRFMLIDTTNGNWGNGYTNNGTILSASNTHILPTDCVVYGTQSVGDSDEIIPIGPTPSFLFSTTTTNFISRYVKKLFNDGNFDNSFLAPTFNDYPLKLGVVKIGPNAGKILVAGRFSSITESVVNGATFYKRLARLNPDGSLDETFNTSEGIPIGFSGAGGVITSLEFQSTGKIIIGGNFTQYNQYLAIPSLIRINDDGSLDTSFNFLFNGAANLGVLSIKILKDDSMIISLDRNYFTRQIAESFGIPFRTIFKLDADGNYDYTWGSQVPVKSTNNLGSLQKVDVANPQFDCRMRFSKTPFTENDSVPNWHTYYLEKKPQINTDTNLISGNTTYGNADDNFDPDNAFNVEAQYIQMEITIQNNNFD
jgi:hypothetical protein